MTQQVAETIEFDSGDDVFSDPIEVVEEYVGLEEAEADPKKAPKYIFGRLNKAYAKDASDDDLAKEVGAIRDRGKAAGFSGGNAAVVATYAHNLERRIMAGIEARAKAKGLKSTPAQIEATYQKHFAASTNALVQRASAALGKDAPDKAPAKTVAMHAPKAKPVSKPAVSPARLGHEPEPKPLGKPIPAVAAAKDWTGARPSHAVSPRPASRSVRDRAVNEVHEAVALLEHPNHHTGNGQQGHGAWAGSGPKVGRSAGHAAEKERAGSGSGGEKSKPAAKGGGGGSGGGGSSPQGSKKAKRDISDDELEQKLSKVLLGKSKASAGDLEALDRELGNVLKTPGAAKKLVTELSKETGVSVATLNKKFGISSGSPKASGAKAPVKAKPKADISDAALERKLSKVLLGKRKATANDLVSLDRELSKILKTPGGAKKLVQELSAETGVSVAVLSKKFGWTEADQRQLLRLKALVASGKRD